ncbi:MAG: hypothetical protein AAGB01_07095, partial [Cyanobacteria bacterium P01_F01_bin.42]
WQALLNMVETDKGQRFSQISLKGYQAVTAQVVIIRYLRYQRSEDEAKYSRQEISLNEVIEAMVIELDLANPSSTKALKNMAAKVTYFFKTKCVPELERCWAEISEIQ